MLHIEMWPIGRLKPYPGNPRMNDGAVDAVAESIRRFGFRQPIVVDAEGVIVAGHTRHRAAQKLGLAEVPVHRASDLAPEQTRALRIADNKTAELADWDFGLLSVEMESLGDAGYDWSALGFSGEELTRMLAPDENTVGVGGVDPDESPEPPATDPVSRRGEVYQLGRHRVMCGDSRSPEAMARLASAGAIDLCFTSPPYMQQRSYGEAEELVGDWDGLMNRVFGAVSPVMKPDGQIIINLGLVHKDKEWQPYWRDWIEAMRTDGWLRFAIYIWDQCDGLPGSDKGRLAPCFELLFHFCRNIRHPNKIVPCKTAGDIIGSTGLRDKNGKRVAMTDAGKSVQPFKIPDALIRVQRQKATVKATGVDHPAVFPWMLPLELINAFTQPDEAILDPFCGSGSTIIACEHAGRRGYGMEIDPVYIDMIRQRWAWQVHGRGCDWAALTPPCAG